MERINRECDTWQKLFKKDKKTKYLQIEPKHNTTFGDESPLPPLPPDFPLDALINIDVIKQN